MLTFVVYLLFNRLFTYAEISFNSRTDAEKYQLKVRRYFEEKAKFVLITFAQYCSRLLARQFACNLFQNCRFSESLEMRVDETLVSRDETLVSRDETLVSRDEILVSRDETLVSRDETLVSRDEILVSRETRQDW